MKLTSGGVSKYFLQDHPGSTNALMDASGNLTASNSYASFGNATNTNFRHGINSPAFIITGQDGMTPVSADSSAKIRSDCSVWYQAGQWTGFAVDMATTVPGLVKSAVGFVGRKLLKRGAKELAEEGAEAALKNCLRCFEAETEVQTDHGLKPIEKIEAGDKVLSYNENTGLLEYQEVLQKFTRSADDIYSVRVEGENKPLGVTSEHPFFVRVYRAGDSLISGDDEGEWRETQQLQADDEIRLANGSWAKVLEVEFKGAGQVYNFTVAGNHNYFVGDLRLLTHNSCGRGCLGDTLFGG